MLYVYDNAIAEDLARSIDPKSEVNDIVRVMGPEGILPLIAEMKEDHIKFPLMCLFREPDTPIDTTRTNFTAMHGGTGTVIDPETQNIYMEKVIPIKLSYTLTMLATNTADSDELLRELLFKYVSQYFINVTLPYEGNRKIRIGLQADPDSVTRKSGALEYIQSGTLYESSFKLNCQGAVYVSYTPKHIERFEMGDVKLS